MRHKEEHVAANRSVAERFQALHAPGRFLILPNAWDAGSARMIESCGAEAIATTSSGLSWSCGYPDGNFLPIGVLAAAVKAIARVIDVPLTVDMEAGYAAAPEEVARNVAAIVDSGGVGVNLEDGNDPPELMAEKIASARRAGDHAGIPLFINARTDVYLHALVPPSRAVAETVARAARYREAGCDGIFVPGLREPAEIEAIVQGIAPLPVNVFVRPGVPPAAALKRLGVRRLSAGGALAMSAQSQTRLLTMAFLEKGDSDELAAHIKDVTYPALNALFARPGGPPGRAS
jgi:2-methylisocitrate lyase-like PEP mutase family enzyme